MVAKYIKTAVPREVDERSGHEATPSEVSGMHANVSGPWPEVDTDEWEVVALDVRPNNSLFSSVGGGAVDHVLMSSLRQVGDVILVHDESAVERRWSSYGLSTVVGCDVVTERGTYIGRVRDYEFDPDDGLVQRIVVDALGLPIVPEGVVSTYALDVSEILSAGMDRVIVAEGAEARVEQLSMSLLQRLQLTAPPWEEDLAAYGDYYATAGLSAEEQKKNKKKHIFRKNTRSCPFFSLRRCHPIT